VIVKKIEHVIVLRELPFNPGCWVFYPVDYVKSKKAGSDCSLSQPRYPKEVIYALKRHFLLVP
jgi:hypothetical protein